MQLLSFALYFFRLLAHAKIEFVKSKEVSQRNTLKKSWWSFGWSVVSWNDFFSLIEDLFCNYVLSIILSHTYLSYHSHILEYLNFFCQCFFLFPLRNKNIRHSGTKLQKNLSYHSLSLSISLTLDVNRSDFYYLVLYSQL